LGFDGGLIPTQEGSNMMKLAQAGLFAAVMAMVCLSAWAGPVEDYNNKGWEANTAKKYTEARKWYRKSAELGNAIAQSKLGIMYENGYGVSQDYVSAHMWYNLAGSNGYKLGAENSDYAAKFMTPAQIAEAQRRAKVCMKSNYKNCD